MDCPPWSLSRPDTAMWCDCGHDVRSGRMRGQPPAGGPPYGPRKTLAAGGPNRPRRPLSVSAADGDATRESHRLRRPFRTGRSEAVSCNGHKENGDERRL